MIKNLQEKSDIFNQYLKNQHNGRIHMGTDRIYDLIQEAHDIFNRTSIYEVIDLVNEQAAKEFLRENYNNPDENAINQYLGIVHEINSI